MSNHTAAPWIVVRELRDGDEIVCDMLNVGWVIPKNGQKLADWEIDATLISAAPELLDALKDAICALECCCVDYDHVLAKAKRAVEKAEKVTV